MEKPAEKQQVEESKGPEKVDQQKEEESKIGVKAINQVAGAGSKDKPV